MFALITILAWNSWKNEFYAYDVHVSANNRLQIEWSYVYIKQKFRNKTLESPSSTSLMGEDSTPSFPTSFIAELKLDVSYCWRELTPQIIFLCNLHHRRINQKTSFAKHQLKLKLYNTILRQVTKHQYCLLN